MKLSKYVPALPASSHPRPVISGRAVGHAVRDIIDHAKESVDMSAFRISLEPTLDALDDAHARGVHIDLLADSQNLDDATTPQTTRDALRGAVDVLREYGDEPYKQHAKSVGRDRAEALIASDVSDEKSPGRMEFGVRFDGPAAAIYDDVHHITAATPKAEAKRVFDAARAVGILVNDPQHDVWDVSTGATSLIDHANHSLLIVTKALESKDMIHKITDAAERGVRTTVITNNIKPPLRDSLLASGVELKSIAWHTIAEPLNIHGTVIATNGVAMVTSLPLVSRAIKGSKGRQSRELGVTVDGTAGRSMMDRLRAAYRDVPAVRPSKS
jgi:hypothetical protein